MPYVVECAHDVHMVSRLTSLSVASGSTTSTWPLLGFWTGAREYMAACNVPPSLAPPVVTSGPGIMGQTGAVVMYWEASPLTPPVSLHWQVIEPIAGARMTDWLVQRCNPGWHQARDIVLCRQQQGMRVRASKAKEWAARLAELHARITYWLRFLIRRSRRHVAFLDTYISYQI